ncbi:hypothetical protein BgiBS90_033129 [Biomphalaria glabrata]|nr:hypothetical protein BgiBS90_033129 [Biomphalaria glabrata]
MTTWRCLQDAILSTLCVFFIAGLPVGSTVASDGISVTLSTPKDRSDHCGYLTCNHSSQADVTFFNELRIYNIANNGSKIASLSQGKHFVSAEGGFDLKRKYLRNSQASLQLSITKPENCLFGLYLCVVDFIDEHGAKQTNTAVAGAEDRGNVSCPNDRVVLKAEKSILDSLARVQKRLQKNDKLLQEKMDRGLNKTTSLIETKMEEINTKYGHFSQAFKDLNLLEDRTKEWTLAFRGTPFIDKAVYEAYLDGTGIPFDVEIGCKVINSSLPCYNHYRNSSILDHWKNIKEVKLAIYQNNVQVHYIIFNGQGSNYLNWFSQRRVLSSSWTDIKWKSTNYFSVEGLASAGRRFYINHVFAGCHLDIGWFSAFDSSPNRCPYHTSASYPLIKFAKGSEADVWQGPNFGVADFFAIFVK